MRLLLIVAIATLGAACGPKPKNAIAPICAVWSCVHDKSGPTECTCLEAGKPQPRPSSVSSDCPEWTCKHDNHGMSECGCVKQ
jgi:hypothetical protein